MNKNQLIETIALVCYFAQSHLQDNWDEEKDKACMLSCTSYVVACLLTQSTKYGPDGVESEVFITVLCDTVLNLQEWTEKATEAVSFFNVLTAPAPEWMF